MKYNPYNKTYVSTKSKRCPNINTSHQKFIKYSSPQSSDGEWVGDDLSTPPKPNLTRFWLQNCQGMVTAQDINRFHFEMEQYLDNNIHYMAFTESRLNPNHTKTTYDIEHGFNHLVSHGRIDLANTPGFNPHSAFQPGGVVSAFHGRMSNRYTKTVRDKAGRWIMHEFVGKEKPLRIYSVYRVNPKSARADTSAWAQQKRYLQTQDIDEDPRKSVINDLLKDVELSVHNGCSVILMGDMNEKLESREKTNKRLFDIGLHNLMQTKLQTKTLPRTHRRGSEAIDHVWVTASLIPAIPTAGFAPFDFLGSSDHRGLCFDVNIDELLDFNVVPLQSMPHRRLQSNIPKRVTKYLDVFTKKWKDFNISERFQQVQKKLKDGDNTNLEADLNNIDQSITDAMRNAERKCCKVPGRISAYWSPTFKKALTSLHKARSHRNKSQYIVPGESIVDGILAYRKAQAAYEEALKHYRYVKQKSPDIRKLDMTKLATDRAEAHNSTTIVEYNKILLHEKDAKSNRKIKYVLKPDHRAGVNSILIPARSEYDTTDTSFDHTDIRSMWDRITPTNGKDIKEWQRITEKSAMEKILLDWQQMHFLQANETPLSTIQWKEQFDDPMFQEEVIHGRYSPPSYLHPTAREVLLHFQRQPGVEDFDFSTTFDEFKAFIKNSKERTGTSPSGRHYGHYKALMQGDKEFLEVIHAIIEISLQHNIILRRWRRTTTTLIEKETGIPFVHRMRAIHIIEAEVQFLAKNFYITKLMKNAEATNLVTDEQYGGRTRRQAQSAVINKVLYYNLSHQMLLPAAFMDDDARACYDRIVTPLSSLECRKWGAPHKLAKFTNSFIEHQTYAIRTGHGISKDTYSYSTEAPIQGSGQGIGWAGPRWLCSGDTCSRILAQTGSGMSFRDPTYTFKVKKQGDYFVDDTATGVTLNTLKQDQHDVFDQLQFIEQLHSDILFSLGHKLAIDKCSFYAADYERGKFKHEHKLIHEMPGSINIRETHTSAPISVKRLQPFQAHKTLGCQLALNFNQKMQFRKLNEKLSHWNSRVKSSFLTAEEKIKSYNTYTSKGVEYILPTSSLSEQQCHDLDKLVTPILYNAHGIQRNCSKCVLYSPTKYGGFGHKSIWHLQGLEKLKFFLAHYRRHDTTGRLIKISMRWTQLESGVSTPFYTHKHNKLAPLLTPTWMTHLWEYLSSCDAEFEEQTKWQYQLPMQNDFFLMDLILDSNIPMESKIIFNEIRIHLQLLTAADIVVIGSGTRILPNIYQGINFRKSSLAWPDTKPFPTKWLKVWKSLLKTYILPHLRHAPLGEFISQTHQSWTSFSNDDGTHITTKGITYKRLHNTRASTFLPTYEVVECSIPADVYTQRDNPVVYGYGSIEIPTPYIRNIMTLWDMYLQAPHWQKTIWGTTEVNETLLNSIRSELESNNVNAAGDGSVKRGKAAQAWSIFRKDNNEILFKSASSVFGDPDHITSLRPETVSSVAAGTFLNMIASTIPNLDAEVIFYSDSESTILNSKRTLLHDVGKVLENDMDATIQNNRIMTKALFKYSMSHVYGHQDNSNNNDEISPIGMINIEMDRLAGIHIEKMIRADTNTSEPMFFPSQQVSIKINNKRVSTYIADELIFSYYKQALNTHYNNVVHLDSLQFSNISWNALRLSLRDSKKRDQITKAIHSQWQTKYVCKKWKLSDNADCPLCDHDNETWEHILRCPNIHLQRVRDEFIVNLRKDLMTLKTNNVLCDYIITSIKQWLNGRDPERLPQAYFFPATHIQNAHTHQEAIGFSLFMKGLLSPKWGEIQELDYDFNRLPANYNKIRWEKKLISSLQTFIINVWNERCKIIHAANIDTNEVRYRQQAWEFLCDIKKKKWKLLHDSNHLLERDEHFFRNTTMINVQNWYDNIKMALERADRKNSNIYTDIRKFFLDEETYEVAKRSVTSVRRKLTESVETARITIQQSIFNLFNNPSLGH